MVEKQFMGIVDENDRKSGTEKSEMSKKKITENKL